MILVLQRVKECNVIVEGTITGEIGLGLLVLQGVSPDDTHEDLDWLVNKTINLRIFSDGEGLMNRSVVDIHGDILVVSQFTLLASTKKGNRPSFIQAAKPEHAEPMYKAFVHALREKTDLKIAEGKFGADMKVSLINDGPVTIIIDSKNRK